MSHYKGCRQKIEEIKVVFVNSGDDLHFEWFVNLRSSSVPTDNENDVVKDEPSCKSLFSIIRICDFQWKVYKND